MTPASAWLLGMIVMAVGVGGLVARGELISRLIALEVAFNGGAVAALAALNARGRADGATLILLAIGVTVSEAVLGLVLWLESQRLRLNPDPDRERASAAEETVQ